MSDKPLSVARRIGLIGRAMLLVILVFFFVDTSVDIWPAVGIHSELCKKAETIAEDKRAAYLETIKREAKVNCEFGDIPIAKVNISGLKTFLSADQGMIGLSAIVAMIGALFRSLLSTANAFRGRGHADNSLTWDLLRPFLAGALAVIVYFVLRGLFLPSVSVTQINPYGFLAISGLVGLFIDELISRCFAARDAVKGRVAS